MTNIYPTDEEKMRRTLSSIAGHATSISMGQHKELIEVLNNIVDELQELNSTLNKDSRTRRAY